MKPLNYWVVAENSESGTWESGPVETRRRYGLCVGYDAYGVGSTPLKQSLADANLCKSLAEKAGFATTLIKNGTARVQDIHDALMELAGKAQVGDTVLFYIATHGGVSPSKNNAALIAYDGSYGTADLASDVAAFAPGVGFIGVVMACRSSAIADPSGLSAGGVEWIPGYTSPSSGAANWLLEHGLAECKANVAWVTSCGADEKSPVIAGLDGTQFGEWFLRQGWQKGYADRRLSGLAYEGGNRDGTNTVLELARYAEAFACGRSDTHPAHVYIHNEALLGKTIVETGVSSSSMGVPSAPTGLQATQGMRDWSVGLEWNASSGATAYRVYRGDECIAYQHTGTSFDDTGCPGQETHAYRVRGLNPAGLGGASDPAPGWRRGEGADDGTWEFEIADGTAAIAGAASATGAVVIPSEADGIPVTEIGTAAFAGCAGLTSVTIPDSVTHIGNNAFAGCTGLATLYVPESWKGTGMLADAGVPEGCTFVYVAADGTLWQYGVDGTIWQCGVDGDDAMLRQVDSESAVLEVPAELCGHVVRGVETDAFAACTNLMALYVPETWVGTDILTNAGLPEGCKVAFRSAATLAVWNSTGADTSGSYLAASTAIGVTVSPLVAGSGLTPYNVPTNTFCAYGYAATDYGAAISAETYWETAFAPDATHRLSFSSLVYTFRHLAKGPTNWAWYYSTNGSDWDMAGDLVVSETNNANLYIERTVDLSSIAALQNVSGTVHFRLVAWGAAVDTRSGTGCFGKRLSANDEVLVFNGSAISLVAPPIVTFAGEGKVGLSNTLSLAVSSLPEGSAVISCTVGDRFPGTVAYADGVATITPTGESAVGNSYRVTAVATNVYGTSTNTFDFAVTRYLPPGAVFIDFEDLGTTSPSYLNNIPITLSGTQWVLHNALTKMETNDHCNGTHALRMNHSWKEGCLASASAAASNGLSTVSFAYATCGTNYTSGSTVSVEVSHDGAEWFTVGEVETLDTHELATYETPYIGIAEPLYVRLRAIGQDSCNIDDILLIPYATNPQRVEWLYSVTDGAATVMGAEPAEGVLSIPAELDGCPVKSVGANAFAGCTGLTGMTIPDGVTNVGTDAFAGCTGLATLYVPESWEGTGMLADAGVPEGCEVVYRGAGPVDGPGKETIDGVVWTYTISAGTATVTGADPAEGNLAIPFALGNCPVTAIESNAFQNCTDMTGVTIPDSVTSIGRYAFYDCTGLAKVTLGRAVQVVGEDAFGNCTGLTMVDIRDLTAWCNIEFRNAEANPSYHAHSLALNGEPIRELAIPAGVDRIPAWGFCDNYALTSVTIFEGVQNIPRSAFNRCNGVTNVSLPNGVTNIGMYAFRSCRDLPEIVLPETLASIDEEAFAYADRMTEMNIPQNVVRIGKGAFAGCSDSIFDDVSVPGVRLVDGWAVALRHPPAGDLELVGVRGIADSLFAGCTGLTHVAVGNGATSIGADAFAGCTGLLAMEIPGSVTVVGKDAFAGSGLATLYVPAAWKGGTVLSQAAVPAGCEIVYASAAPQTLDWEALAAECTTADRVELAATASGGGKVLFEVVSGPAVVEGHVLAFRGTGTVTVRAFQPGTARWLAVEETRTISVVERSDGRLVHVDLAANYPDGWTDGSNGGTGFGAWDLDIRFGSGTGWAGCGIWNPSANGFAGTWEGKGKAFGLVGKGSGYSVTASRSFIRPLCIGDSFSLEMAVNWDSNLEGATKGFALTAGGEDIVVVNHGAYPGNISVNGNVDYSFLNVPGLHPMTWTFTVVDGTTLRFTATGRDDPANVCTGLLKVASSAIDAFRLQSVNQYAGDSTQTAADCRQNYYDNFRLNLALSAPVEVPSAWLEANAPAILAANGNDCELAALATASNGCNAVWECYVAGLDPENAEQAFIAAISVVDGKPVVSSDPRDENARNYTVYGKKSLTDGTEVWTDVTANPNVAAEGYRFFRVGVLLKPE